MDYILTQKQKFSVLVQLITQHCQDAKMFLFNSRTYLNIKLKIKYLEESAVLHHSEQVLIFVETIRFSHMQIDLTRQFDDIYIIYA